MLTSAQQQQAAACSYNLFRVPVPSCFLLMNDEQRNHTALQLKVAGIFCLTEGHSSTDVSGTAGQNGWICGPGEEGNLLLNKNKLVEPQTRLSWHPDSQEGSHNSTELLGERTDFSAQVPETIFGKKTPLG